MSPGNERLNFWQVRLVIGLVAAVHDDDEDDDDEDVYFYYFY